MRVPATITLLLACSVSLPSHLTSQTKAQEIAASFTKHKHVVKEKRGVRAEKYKDVQSEPTAVQNLTDYAGVYEVAELGYVINIQVANDGTIGAYGAERTRTFELENPKIAGAVLTGTKVYRDGRRERFEGAFLTRTDRDSPTDPGTVTFGLGVVLTVPVEHAGNTYDKLFYQLNR